MTRTPLVVANWKMNTDLELARTLAASAREFVPPLTAELDIVLCPPFPWIVPVTETLGTSSVGVGAQDCSPHPDGAFTGDVSAAMLAAWCDTVIVGHSERRTVHGETDEDVARKLASVLSHNMRPLLCVGESLPEREAGTAESVISRQVYAALDGCDPQNLARVIVAYEPVWAIGTGLAATPDDAQAMAAHIRQEIATLNSDVATSIRILYGGSVNAANAADLTNGYDVDGALVGSASLDPAGFAGICLAICRPLELI